MELLLIISAIMLLGSIAIAIWSNREFSKWDKKSDSLLAELNDQERIINELANTRELRKWCIELSRGIDGVDLHLAQEIYDWVRDDTTR